MTSSVLSYENALKSFVPDILLRKLRRRMGSKIEVGSKFIRGACLLADISGFTALSGELCTSGVHGLDLLRQATSDFLAKFIHIVHAFGGDGMDSIVLIDCIKLFSVLSFAGDALVCMFWPSEGSHSSEDYRLCRKATECGFILKDHCTDRLKAHIAVSYGELSFSFLGGYMNDWVYIVNGHCMADLSSCITDASSRQLVMSSSCFHSLVKSGGCFDIRYTTLPSGNIRIDRIERLERVVSGNLELVLRVANEIVGNNLISSGSELDESVEELVVENDIRPPEKIFMRKNCEKVILKCSSHILKFLPRPVVATLAAGYFQPISELRVVTTVFVKLDSYSLETHRKADSLQSFFYSAQVALFNAGGCLRQFLVDDKGCVLIALWGVPSSSFGNNATRALYFSSQLCRTTQSLGHSCSIGITTGPAFCGTIGSSVRQDYAAIGSKVNLAARFMVKAEGRIIIDEATHISLPNEIQNCIVQLDPLHVKGSAQPVQAFSVDWTVDGAMGSNLYNILMDSFLPRHEDDDSVRTSMSFDSLDAMNEDVLSRAVGFDDYCHGIVQSSDDFRAMQTNLCCNLVDTLDAAMTRIMNFEYGDRTGTIDSSASDKENSQDITDCGAPSTRETSFTCGDDQVPLMQFIVVEGGQGMGKSEVCRYFRRLSISNKVRNIALRARYVDENIEYGVARKLFQELVGANLQSCPERRIISLQLLRRAYPFLSEDDIVLLKFPVFKAALGLKWHLSVLSGKHQNQKQVLPFEISNTMSWKYSVGHVLVDIMKCLIADDPLTIIIDDAHYCDKLTWNVLHLLSINVRFPVVALIAVRQSSISELLNPAMTLMSPSIGRHHGHNQSFTHPTGRSFWGNDRSERSLKSRGLRTIKTPVMVAVDTLLLHSSHVNKFYKNIKITLRPLTTEQLSSLLSTVWGPSITVTDELLEILSNATDRNPFWCKCFAEFTREYGIDCLRRAAYEVVTPGHSSEGNSSVTHSPPFGSRVSHSAHSYSPQQPAASECLINILANMMDKLTVSEQMVLKMSSVIGNKFSIPLLKCLLPEDSLPKLKSALHSLIKWRFIEIIPPTSEKLFSFQNETIRDSVYRIIPPR